jgi:DNA ligase-4
LNIAQDRAEREAILRSMLKRTTANEQKWIVRIILKGLLGPLSPSSSSMTRSLVSCLLAELKIGMSEKTIFNYFHEDAVDYFNVTSNLRKVCEDLKNPQKKLIHDQVTLFNPVKPMLAARYPPEKVPKLMENKQFIIETKYDGERLQVHRDGDTIKLFSRNSNDVTDIYGEHIIPVIKELVKTSRVILDGEILIWDTIAERYEDFGKLKTFGPSAPPPTVQQPRLQMFSYCTVSR